MRRLSALISMMLILFAFGYGTERIVLLEYFTNAG